MFRASLLRFATSVGTYGGCEHHGATGCLTKSASTHMESLPLLTAALDSGGAAPDDTGGKKKGAVPCWARLAAGGEGGAASRTCIPCETRTPASNSCSRRVAFPIVIRIFGSPQRALPPQALLGCAAAQPLSRPAVPNRAPGMAPTAFPMMQRLTSSAASFLVSSCSCGCHPVYMSILPVAAAGGPGGRGRSASWSCSARRGPGQPRPRPPQWRLLLPLRQRHAGWRRAMRCGLRPPLRPLRRAAPEALSQSSSCSQTASSRLGSSCPTTGTTTTRHHRTPQRMQPPARRQARRLPQPTAAQPAMRRIRRQPARATTPAVAPAARAHPR
jgi:hypothetical protein